MKKALLAALACVFAVLIFSACNLIAPKNEKQIIEDVQRDAEVFTRYGVNIYDVRIEKRQTDTNNKRDTVYAWFKAKSGQIDCTIGLRLVYVLYNDGWLLENTQDYQKESWSVYPLEGVTQEQAEDVIREEYSDFEVISNNDDLKNGISAYTFTAQSTQNYLTYKDTVEVLFTFDQERSEWMDSIQVLNHEEAWNLNGTWKYVFHEGGGFGYPDCDISATITIEGFDGKAVLGSYSIKYDYFNELNFDNSGSMETEELSINGGKEKRRGVTESWSTMSGDWTGFYFDKEQGVLFKNPFDWEWYPMERK